MFQGRGQDITLGVGYEPRLWREREPPAGVQGRAPGGGPEGGKPSPEAESFVAFEAAAEEPNLTLVTDLFGEAKFADWEGLAPKPPCPRPGVGVFLRH